MGWGQSIAEAWDGATQMARDAASTAGESMANTARAAADAASRAADYAAEKANQAADYTAEKARQAADYAKQKAAEAKQKAVELYEAGKEKTVAAYRAVADFTRERINDAKAMKEAAYLTWEAGKGAADAAGRYASQSMRDWAQGKFDQATESFNKAREFFGAYSPAKVPCLACLKESSGEARGGRINKREQLMADANATGDPGAMAGAAQMAQDMEAVELARLSADVYNDNPNPPEPWQAVDLNDPVWRKKLRIDAKTAEAAKARIYVLDAPFPGGPRTVAAFQGTEPGFDDPLSSNDLITNHDQALGADTEQYMAAKRMGRQLAKYDSNTVVTGHSLGGGKAQAAGAVGGLRGMMFNSAGLHPDTVPGQNMEQVGSQFTQYRAQSSDAYLNGDPLTGLQNDQEAQAALVNHLDRDIQALETMGQSQLVQGLIGDYSPTEVQQGLAERVFGTTLDQARENKKRFGYHIPPARGRIEPITSKYDDGSNVGLHPGDQHSIQTMINGIEARKFSNVQSMLGAVGSNEDPGSYLGPYKTQYH